MGALQTIAVDVASTQEGLSAAYRECQSPATPFSSSLGWNYSAAIEAKFVHALSI
jgi:hypothetical protein